jgi:DNA-binding beta-propeller fold protein YncE
MSQTKGLKMMKLKTLYLLISSIIVLTVAVFTGIYYLNLADDVAAPVKNLNPNAPPTFSQQIYGDFGDSALNKPMDIAKIGNFLFVTDTNNKRVQAFDLAGTPIFKFGKEGNGPGEFMFPYGVSGDKKGNVYVADLYNGNISIFDKKGKFIEFFKEADEKNKVIEAPGGLRIFDEKLYVTDITKNKVFVFDLKGKKLLEVGNKTSGDGEGELLAPNAVTVSKDGNIYVTDTGNQRIQIFDKKGKFLKIINGSEDGKGSSVFVNPRGIGVNSQGVLYVVNNLTHNVYGFDKDGKKLFEFGGMGDQNEQFYLPNGLFIDENDQVFVTDTLNQRVALYY